MSSALGAGALQDAASKRSILMHSVTAAMFDAVIRSRKSVRAFRPDPVPRSQLVEILNMARAPSSVQLPALARVWLLAGDAKRALDEAILQAHVANTVPLFSPFPQPTPSDCKGRVEDFSQRYYSALGIDRADMVRSCAPNWSLTSLFFDAPVGLIFTIDAALTKHSCLDYGVFLQNLMLAAQVRGLATCPQVSFVRFQSSSPSIWGSLRGSGDMWDVVRLCG